MALTPTGLTIKRLPEIIENTEASGQKLVHPQFSLQDDDELLTQLSYIYGEIAASLYEEMQAINDNFKLTAAEGRNLDDLGYLRKVLRIRASSTQGYVLLSGDKNTLVPANTIFENNETGERYVLAQSVKLDTLKSVVLMLTVFDPRVGVFIVSVDGKTYQHETDGTVGTAAILTAIAAEINADPLAKVTAEVPNATFDLYLRSKTDEEHQFQINSAMRIIKASTYGFVYAQETGPRPATTNSITKIITPVLGLDSVVNKVALTPGRDIETDEEYRERIKASASISGNATIPSITANILNTPGVSYAKVSENNTMEVAEDGKPPKSIECIVQGGTDADVAAAIFTKAAGIETYGNVTTLHSYRGFDYELKFSRPTQVNIAVKVSYTRYLEETFMDGAEDAMRAAVIEYVNNLDLGTDLIPKRLCGPLYAATKGIEDVTVEVQKITSPGDAPVLANWQSGKVSITDREFTQTSISDITILEV